MSGSCLQRAGRVLSRYPALALVPLMWDGIIALMYLLLGGRMDLVSPGNRVQLKLVLPPSLPSGNELLQTQVGGIQLSPGAPFPGATDLLLGVVLAMLMGALVKAGYLYLLVRALSGEPPTAESFRAGISRFGGRLLVWNLIVFAALLLSMALMMALGPLLMVIGLVVALWFYLTEFLVVAEDLPLLTAAGQAGSRLRQHLANLAPVFLAALALAAVLTLALSAARLQVLWVTAPVWAYLGTWLALGVLAALVPEQEPAAA